jgi:hypothetical protein
VGVRRYRCTPCGATTTVAPRGVLRRRLYGAQPIALAFVLFGLEKLSVELVRRAIAPTVSHREAAEGATWSTLRRWAHEAKAGTLFPQSRVCPSSFSLRAAAARVAEMLQGLGPRVAGLLERVWQGALEAAW